MKKALLTFALSTLSITAQAEKDSHHWDYKNTNEWAACSPAYAECKLGKRQSPVNINSKDVQFSSFGPIQTSYKPSQGVVINNGHTIEVKLPDAGFATVPSGTYKLIQFHFHTPSEEKIDGKNFPLSAHLVHQNKDGKLAVIALLFKEGKVNMALEEIFEKMPNKVGKVDLSVPYDPTALLPLNSDYYFFTGSLTTPPCSEDVAWQVLKTPVEISKSQITQFKKIFKANARPVQPLNGRVVLESK